MKIHAYSDLFLSDAQRNLAAGFDYAVNDCGIAPELLSQGFVSSAYCRRFEMGDAGVVSGQSGIELIRRIFSHLMPDMSFPAQTMRLERTPDYWAGWVLAYYQWYTAHRFAAIFARIPLADIIAMYPLFHEMDLGNVVEALEQRYRRVNLESNLKTIRKARRLSQGALAELAGVHVRSIQLYEQRVNDIDKAQGATLYRLSRVLGCTIEDLLEEPERCQNVMTDA